MTTYIGIDFEYANDTTGSICAYGLAFEDHSLEHGFVKLHESCPKQKRSRHHNITQEQTDGGMEFIELYKRLEELNADGELVLVAHDLKSDRRAWLAAQALFGLPVLDLTWVDSLVIARANLGLEKNQGKAGVATMSEHYGLTIEHHNPADDALVSMVVLQHGTPTHFINDVPKRHKRKRHSATQRNEATT